MTDEMIYKVAEAMKDHDQHRPFEAEGIKITGDSDFEIMEKSADINLPAWDSNDYYAEFLGTDVHDWCKALNLDYLKIKMYLAEMACCPVGYISDYEIKDYIVEEYEKEVFDLIADVIEDQLADYISSAEYFLEEYENWHREARRDNE